MRATNRLNEFLADNPPTRPNKRDGWPKGYSEELDGYVFMPTNIPHRILSRAGEVLGTFSTRAGAIAAFDQRDDAVYVVVGSLVVAEKGGAQ